MGPTKNKDFWGVQMIFNWKKGDDVQVPVASFWEITFPRLAQQKSVYHSGLLASAISTRNEHLICSYENMTYTTEN